jgi:hypothetical protein
MRWSRHRGSSSDLLFLRMEPEAEAADATNFVPAIALVVEFWIRMKNIAGPSGFEPETAGCLRRIKSPVLYLAELRALFNLSLVYGIIYLFMPIVESLSE